MPQNSKNEDYGKILFSWDFPEFPQHKREASWYFWGAIVVILLLIYSIVTSNFLFAILVVISAATVLLFQRSNNQVEFKITEDGILVNRKFYKYEEIKNFYIIYNPPEVKTLYFELKSILKPRIPISLENQNPVKIREFLLKYLEEDLDRNDEPTSDQFSRMFKL